MGRVLHASINPANLTFFSDRGIALQASSPTPVVDSLGPYREHAVEVRLSQGRSTLTNRLEGRW